MWLGDRPTPSRKSHSREPDLTCLTDQKLIGKL